MTRPKILLTRKWPASVEALAAQMFDVTCNPDDRPMDRAAMRAALENYDAVLATVTDDVKEGTFTNLKPLAKILANYGVGFSHIDIEGARDAGIIVTNTPDVLNDCTLVVRVKASVKLGQAIGQVGDRRT